MATRKKGLAPSIIKEVSTLNKVKVDQETLEEFQAYLEWVGINSVDEGIEKAMAYVIADDSDWAKHKKSLAKVSKTTADKATKEAEEIEAADA